jgi:hypothetical protein
VYQTYVRVGRHNWLLATAGEIEIRLAELAAARQQHSGSNNDQESAGPGEEAAQVLTGGG